MQGLIRWIEVHPRSARAILGVFAAVNGLAAYKVVSLHPLLAALNALMGVMLLLSNWLATAAMETASMRPSRASPRALRAL